ncbi:hypothetical protein COO59_06365 [Mixta theicola]|uniref:Tip attachment protein J central straight fiber domain-containing protein n=1 Tax=Mixta theicola TaxID=1458355 RepID=A0A2K1QCH5_9GAMM|nr:hypothetical protein [Mixta theicola]PNS12730.1 hypothetical protein COO59_06365 [Mixta theicola]GLR10313.1 hypothetical protein GCM10007905_30330 [Mixta theicola]
MKRVKDARVTNAKIGIFIQSNNYVANKFGWRLDKARTFEGYGSEGNGALKQTNVTISGGKVTVGAAG